MNKRQISLLAAGAAITGPLLWLNSCISIPSETEAVASFDADRYIGK